MFECRFAWQARQARGIVHLAKSQQALRFVVVSTTTIIKLHSTPLHYNTTTTTLHYTDKITTLHLHYTPLHCTTIITVFDCIIHYANCSTLRSTSLHYVTFNDATPDQNYSYNTTTTTTNTTTLRTDYITVHYTTLHHTAPHHATLHYTN